MAQQQRAFPCTGFHTQHGKISIPLLHYSRRKTSNKKLTEETPCATTSRQRLHAISDHQSKILKAFNESLTIESSCKQPPLLSKPRPLLSGGSRGRTRGPPSPPLFLDQGRKKCFETRSSPPPCLGVWMTGSPLIERSRSATAFSMTVLESVSLLLT